jgi:probable nitrogen fixation protein
MIRQMRALDSYGTYDGQSAENLLGQLVLTRERKAQIPIVGDPDEEIIAQVKAFYNAIATLIEKECGMMAVSLVHLSHEGFGRALITVGKLVVCDRTLRDVHRFGFESLSKMKTEGDKILSVALGILGEHADVAGM